jgi:hypothetical protein
MTVASPCGEEVAPLVVATTGPCGAGQFWSVGCGSTFGAEAVVLLAETGAVGAVGPERFVGALVTVALDEAATDDGSLAGGLSDPPQAAADSAQVKRTIRI